MDKKEIVETLMQRRTAFLRRGGISDDSELEFDQAAIEAMVTDCLNKRWSTLDILSYGTASEHVNPFLDEATAIARMAKIAEKYH